MKVNVFEGARRITLLIAVLWAIGVVVFTWNNEPNVPLSYVIVWIGNPPIRIAEGKCKDEDLRDWKYITTAKSTSVRVSFCFTAHRADSGEWLIPYELDEKDPKRGWMNSKYSTQVSDYKRRVVGSFQLSTADEAWADSQWWPERRQQVGWGVVWLIGGWVALWVLSFVIGWIVRGFAGIPMGKDRRPEN